MMNWKYLFCALFMLLAGRMDATTFPEAGVTADRLVRMGMEDVRVKETGDILRIAYEDNVYRGTYRGLGAVIGMLLDEGTAAGAIHLVVLEDRVPQIAVRIPEEAVAGYRTGAWSWEQLVGSLQIGYDTDEDMRQLEAVKALNRSAGKVDLVVYPEVVLNNSWLDKLYGTVVNLQSRYQYPFIDRISIHVIRIKVSHTLIIPEEQRIISKQN